MTKLFEPLAAGGAFFSVDGIDALVRPIRTDDADALVAFHRGLSVASISRRYFYPHLELRAEEVAHFTQVDGRDRVALVVERAGELIAVGRYDRLADPSQAEVAFVVADTFQHKGVATMLLRRLADIARSAGITSLVAEVLAENSAMLSVFHAAGFPTVSKSEWGTIELTMAITVPATE